MGVYIMIKKLSFILLFATLNANSAELIAKFPVGNVIITDTICPIGELVDDYPYGGYTISNKGKIHKGCWDRAKNSQPQMINFIEKIDAAHYEYNKIYSTHFK